MVFCENCGENVRPNIYFSWNGFFRGLGIFYLIYVISKIPQCPSCNFPMPRKTMASTICMPQFVAGFVGGKLQLIHPIDSIACACKRHFLKSRFGLSQYLINIWMKTTPLNTVVSEVSEISQKTMSLSNNIWSCDLYDKEAIKILDQLGSHILVREKDERTQKAVCGKRGL